MPRPQLDTRKRGEFPLRTGALRVIAALVPALLTALSAAAAPCTLEDLYGATGNRFQGAIGFQNREANVATQAATGYGLGIDDMVIGWREFTLEEDTTACRSGSCATIQLSDSQLFAANSVIGVSVNDASPSANDCDLDGTTDTPQTFDCNGNGIDDVVVDVRWAENPQPSTDGRDELVILDAVSPGHYRGQIEITSSFDTPGAVFVATQGDTNPTVVATYVDLDDGTGKVCQNNVDTAQWGNVQDSATVFLNVAQVVVNRTILSDNGDQDGWADDHETVELRVEVSNKSGRALTGLNLRLASNDPSVACITRGTIHFGNLGPAESRFSDEAFEFIVAEVNRSDAFADLTAQLSVTMDANEFQSPLVPQSVVLDLDLDALGGSGPTVFFEGFESGFGSFTTMHLDEALNPPDSDPGNNDAGLQLSDGYRCQYNDPGLFCAGGACAPADCFPNPSGAPDAYWWTTTADRAFSGEQSLYWGVELDPSLGYTTPLGQLEAVGTQLPVNLGWDRVCESDRGSPCQTDQDCPGGNQACVRVQPTLSFKHQISLMDHRTINATAERSPDRGVVQVQLADQDGNPLGNWIKLQPYVNIYDTQANSNFFSCTFDPIDDGNDEDSLFDPMFVGRGPSTTCDPEFAFAHQGNTFGAPGAHLVGDATDGPGLGGAHGVGTWVEPQFDLERFRGRRLRFRLLATSLKLSTITSWEDAFLFNPDPGDDGWFVDDFRVSDTLSNPAVVVPDLNDNSALPACGAACGFVGASVSARPTSSRAPGQVVELDASGSSFDVCLEGVLEYRFTLDVDRSGSRSPGDVTIRNWTQSPSALHTPQGSVQYVVEVRCSSDRNCAGEQVVSVDVDCPVGPSGLQDSDPGSANVFLERALPGQRSLVMPERQRLTWGSAATVDALRGDLSTLRTDASFVDAVTGCVTNNSTESFELVDRLVPASGQGVWYLLRSAERCNRAAGGSYGGVGEAVDRDAQIGASPLACPD